MIATPQVRVSRVKRPAVRWHGGKWIAGKWIIDNMPAHSVYCEPYGGGANVLLQKPCCGPEVYNDLDGAVVNLFRVLQNPISAETLRRRLEFTPFARAEFDRSYEPPTDDIDFAWKTIVRSQMGHGTDSVTRTCRTGFRSKLTGSRAIPSETWERWPSSVPDLVDRLRGVTIERRDAVEVMLRFDRTDTLFYVDPPYVQSSRSSLGRRGVATHGYRHEMSDEDHRALSAALHGMKGMVMLSGYKTALYRELYGGWKSLESAALADGAKPRTEVLWFNAAAWEHRPQKQLAFATGAEA